MNNFTISQKAISPLSLDRKPVVIRDWKPLRKGDSLQGFFTCVLPSGLVLYECSFHERSDGKKWIGLPARSYKKQGESKPSYFRLVDFDAKESAAKFQSAVVNAMVQYLEDCQL